MNVNIIKKANIKTNLRKYIKMLKRKKISINDLVRKKGNHRHKSE